LLTKGGFYHAGQVCVSVQRVFAQRKIARPLAERLAEAAQRLKVGDPTLPDTEVGPLIREREVERVHEWVREAVRRGAALLCGGRPAFGGAEKGTGTFCAEHPEGRSGKRCLSPFPPAVKPDRDLAAINTQTRRLVEYSLAVAVTLAIWCAWIDVLPALNVLHRVQIWPTLCVTANLMTAEGQSQPKGMEPAGTITLADLALAAVVLATSVIAAKNIPGLLEMAVLQHLPLDAGARYALATVSRYVITLVGVLVCFGTLGVGWSKVQWLVAGMGVGLGFGLQEIFANFISGLIILFERPVRVGDVVTIDDISGVVSRIRIRATTITDWDRKELIIPNKEFITGRVLNWTLSDKVNRVVINVQVAYGSNTQLATEILARLAKDHPSVLADPPPDVALESLDDGSLKFVLRCFLPNFDNRGTVIHELHMAIHREFRQAGIDLALPQQEVHVRSIDVPLPIFPPAGARDRLARPFGPEAPAERAA
jgi:potassium efflux system protein